MFSKWWGWIRRSKEGGKGKKYKGGLVDTRKLTRKSNGLKVFVLGGEGRNPGLFVKHLGGWNQQGNGKGGGKDPFAELWSWGEKGLRGKVEKNCWVFGQSCTGKKQGSNVSEPKHALGVIHEGKCNNKKKRQSAHQQGEWAGIAKRGKRGPRNWVRENVDTCVSSTPKEEKGSKRKGAKSSHLGTY